MLARQGLSVLFWVLAGCAGAPLRQGHVGSGQAGIVSLQVQTLSDGGSGWRAIAPGETLQSGDRFTMRIEVDQPAFIYVMQVSHNDPPVLLYPMALADAKKASPDRPTHVPENAAWLRLDDRAGEENLYLVASTRSLGQDEVKAEMQRRPQADLSRSRDPTEGPPPVLTGGNKGPGYDSVRMLMWAPLDERGIAVLRFWFRHK